MAKTWNHFKFSLLLLNCYFFTKFSKTAKYSVHLASHALVCFKSNLQADDYLSNETKFVKIGQS